MEAADYDGRDGGGLSLRVRSFHTDITRCSKMNDLPDHKLPTQASGAIRCPPCLGYAMPIPDGTNYSRGAVPWSTWNALTECPTGEENKEKNKRRGARALLEANAE